MSAILDQLRDLASRGEVRISEHGYDELAEDGLSARDVVAGLPDAVFVEEYADYRRDPACSCFSETRRAIPFTLSGAYRKAPLRLLYWLQRIVQTLRGGLMIS